MLNLFIYAFMAIVVYGAWAEATEPKKVRRNIGERRARAAKRRAEYARLETQRAVIVPVQTAFWKD
jgi:hypothetical protein